MSPPTLTLDPTFVAASRAGAVTRARVEATPPPIAGPPSPSCGHAARPAPVPLRPISPPAAGRPTPSLAASPPADNPATPAQPDSDPNASIITTFTNSPPVPTVATRLRRTPGAAAGPDARGGTRPTAASDLRRSRSHLRLTDPAAGDGTHPDARRLAERLFTCGAERLTCAALAGVPSSNTHAEREVRPAVRMGEPRYRNRGDAGATTRAVSVTVFRTPKHRGPDPLPARTDARRTSTATGTLPPLPETVSSPGGSVTVALLQHR